MTGLILPRRKFLTGLMGLVAAPSVVKVASLMPVKVIEQESYLIEGAMEYYTNGYQTIALGYQITREEISNSLYASQISAMNRALIESFQRTKETMAADMMNGVWK